MPSWSPVTTWIYINLDFLPHHGVPLEAVHKLRHLFLDHSRPIPSPLSSCVIFWHTPTSPPTRWRNLWIGNAISMIDYFVRHTLAAHGYFSYWSNFWCFCGEKFDFHYYISMVRVSYSAVIVFSFQPPASSSSSVICCYTPSQLLSFVIFWLTSRTPWLDDVIYEQLLIYIYPSIN